MFGLFKKKSEVEKLREQYEKLMNDAFNDKIMKKIKETATA